MVSTGALWLKSPRSVHCITTASGLPPGVARRAAMALSRRVSLCLEWDSGSVSTPCNLNPGENREASLSVSDSPTSQAPPGQQGAAPQVHLLSNCAILVIECGIPIRVFN
jgi:hypothetical protein